MTSSTQPRIAITRYLGSRSCLESFQYLPSPTPDIPVIAVVDLQRPEALMWVKRMKPMGMHYNLEEVPGVRRAGIDDNDSSTTASFRL